jgi:hypothetical protein
MNITDEMVNDVGILVDVYSSGIIIVNWSEKENPRISSRNMEQIRRRKPSIWGPEVQPT